jgi:DNA helicase-4
VHAARTGALTAWHGEVQTALERATSDRSWLPQERVERLVSARPDTSGLQTQDLRTDRERAAALLTEERLRAAAAETNETVLRTTLTEHREFFDTIERSPLTDEQARAVITYDNRVHVIAAAGSGKTSVMVGRAAYAVHRGLTTPDRILLLAFNRDAARELQERIHDRFAAAGIPSAGIRATTFHAFGLDVISAATGSKPKVAPWVASGHDQRELQAIISELRDGDPQFARDWDTFRLLHARAIGGLTDPPEPDGWDAKRRQAGSRTYRGEVVRSHGERLIADWLYLNHLEYEYERPYVHDTVTATHRQYHPDFYYPGLVAWHEHWGVDAEGNPPAEWRGYKESMRWKRELHRQQRTTLIETTWAGVMNGTDLPKLEAQLRKLGAHPRWDPNRPIRGGKPLQDDDLLRLVRTFMSHVKSNGFTRHDVEARLPALPQGARDRAAAFLPLYWRLHDAWHERLRAGGYVDFDDMLVQASEHLAAGDYDSRYELVMVDEFQDASRARARLVQCLVAQPGRFLLAVGDDWQSINRFAGSDLSVLTRFHEHFGAGPDLFLTTTFRCHQTSIRPPGSSRATRSRSANRSPRSTLASRTCARTRVCNCGRWPTGTRCRARSATS